MAECVCDADEFFHFVDLLPDSRHNAGSGHVFVSFELPRWLYRKCYIRTFLRVSWMGIARFSASVNFPAYFHDTGAAHLIWLFVNGAAQTIAGFVVAIL